MLPSHANQNRNMDMAAGWFKPGLAFVVIIFGALVAFEIFNFSTTELALSDMLGKLTFAGIPWATVLALAFCGIDFAGIARLFTPEEGLDEPKEVWYLFGAWLLAATMNAILTWWGVAMAITNHAVQSSAVVDPGTITEVVPVFVAIMVWVIRILIIGTLSLAMDRLLHPGAHQRTAFQVVTGQSGSRQPDDNRVTNYPTQQPMHIPQTLGAAIPQRQPMPRAASGTSSRPGAARFSGPADEPGEAIFDGPARGGANGAVNTEPTYHSLNGSPRPNNNTARFK